MGCGASDGWQGLVNDEAHGYGYRHYAAPRTRFELRSEICGMERGGDASCRLAAWTRTGVMLVIHRRVGSSFLGGGVRGGRYLGGGSFLLGCCGSAAVIRVMPVWCWYATYGRNWGDDWWYWRGSSHPQKCIDGNWQRRRSTSWGCWGYWRKLCDY